jgi:N-acetylmuramoyl-L-alanine amidase
MRPTKSSLAPWPVVPPRPSTSRRTPRQWDGQAILFGSKTFCALLGDKLKTLDGWEDRRHGDFGDIWGVMWHHTGNSNATAESIRDGRPDLEGPVSNLHIAPDGTVTIVAVGVCWHAGKGDYPGLPSDNANNRLIGIECAWPTVRPDGSYDEGERWPDAQIISMRDVGAALTNKLGYAAERNIGHKEWAGAKQGKWDPGNIAMDWFRGEIAKAMRGEFHKPEVVPPPVPIEVPHLPAPSNPRPDRVLLEEIWTQLRGPEGNGWPQLGNKTLIDYVSALGSYAADLDKRIAELDAKLDAAKPPRPSKKTPGKKAPAKKAPAKRATAKKKP